MEPTSDVQPTPATPPERATAHGDAPPPARKHYSTNDLLPSPRIAIHQHDSATDAERPTLNYTTSAPPGSPFQSPMRHHRRTPSRHREIKETLNARTQYTSDENEGTQHRINQYTIREEIGRGSYGAVYLANDQFGQEFAIKAFSKSRLRKRAQSNILRRPAPGGLSRLGPGPGRGPWAAHKRQLSSQEEAEAKDALHLIREEIAIMKKLNHDNLVSLIEVLDDPEEDTMYMVLEMCRKGVIMKVDLDENADPYEEELCRHWFRDLILGIEYLHAQGIVHRDIKPDNLLLTQDNVLKIVDFGVSELFEKPESMMTKKSAGSPAFLPPELCIAKHGDVSGKAADIWSMGVSLYCLKYGFLPFKGTGVLDMYEAIRTQELHLPLDEGEDFADLMRGLLDKNPETRVTMSEIRTHPWVTKQGIDSLLPEEENCSDLIEFPNELEVNHAVTRKISNLMIVMMAISKFKGLVSKSRNGTPVGTKSLPLTPKLLAEGTIPEEPSDKISQGGADDDTRANARQRSIAEEAAELIEQRKAYFAKLNQAPSPEPSENAPGSGEKGHAHDMTDRPRLFLGIGVGGHDEFASPSPGEEPAAFVSDSPTGIDFDVYDRAFSAEVTRIRSQKSKKGARTYLTRLVGETEMAKYANDDCMVLETGKDLATTVHEKAARRLARNREERRGGQHEPTDILNSERPEGTSKAKDLAKDQSHKFADLVTSLTGRKKEPQ